MAKGGTPKAYRHEGVVLKKIPVVPEPPLQIGGVV
mgnify:CR=1 FL=1|tara:strand:- start:494 stop:598 length:105 start_codon:yes stop_codon:yes gene_type:complete